MSAGWRRPCSVIAVFVVVVVAASGGGSDRRADHARGGRRARDQARARRRLPIVPGGPIAPARYGGLAALWAATNVVGLQPGTAAAYQKRLTAHRPAGLPADRRPRQQPDPDRRPAAADRLPLPERRRPGSRPPPVLQRRHVRRARRPGADRQRGGQPRDRRDRNRTTTRSRSCSATPASSASDATHLNTPDDAYQLPDGSFTVADAYNCRILFVRAACDRAPVRPLRRLPPRPAERVRPGQRRHADSRRRSAGQRDPGQLDRRHQRRAGSSSSPSRRRSPTRRIPSRSPVAGSSWPTTRARATS